MAKTVIVTGGTKGIGRATTIKLANEGYRVVINYHSDDASAEEALALCQQTGAEAILIKADVGSYGAVQHLIETTIAKFRSIDVLINNAGLNIDKYLHELTEEDWDEVVSTNMKSVFLTSQMASKYMLQQDSGGVILNLGASTAIRGRVKGVNYCASKAGVLTMTKCLAMELAPKIRVNCIIPGIIRTGEVTAKFRLDEPDGLEATQKLIPLRRIGSADEVAEMISLMLSDKARYITGQKLIVDGGEFMY